MSHGSRNPRRVVPVILGIAAVSILWSCDGQNVFAPGTGGGGKGGVGGLPPTVQIQQPREPAARPIGDSVLITARAVDDAGVDSLVFLGVAFRGDRDLGTDTIVSRYVSKVVRFGASVRDTTISRYLAATPDTTRETSVLFAVAYDSQGNVAADSVQLIIGGPRVQFLTIEDNQQLQAGLSLNLQVEAVDPEGILDMEIHVTGTFERTIAFAFTPPKDTVLVDTFLVIPPGITGEIAVTAVARNGLNVTGQDGPINLQITSSTVADDIPPTVAVLPSSNERLEVDDVITVVVSGFDDPQGSGIASAGYTVKAISPERGDTLVRTDQANFSPARTGNLTSTFTFLPFNVDELALPDTLIFEVTGWMVDGDGNCSAAVVEGVPSKLPCASLPGGQRGADGRIGVRLPRVIVAGNTVALPAGGEIMDAAVDTARGNLLLSNIQRNRVEVFRLGTETFGPAIGVGSEPWGLTLSRDGDRLLVANSGGTNISIVDLDQERELEQQRFFAPDAVIFDVELKESDSGFSFVIREYPQPTSPSFSDRPQFIAVDSFGNIIYSTRTTSVGDIGTARKAYHPPGAPRSEVKLFVEHGANVEAEDFWAFAHIDSIGAALDTVSVDSFGNAFVVAGLTLFDHIPGFPEQVIQATANTSILDPVENAWGDIVALGSDAYVTPGARWNIPSFGFSDITYVSASGDGGWVVIGEGATSPTGRVMLYRAAQRDTTDLSTTLRVWDEVINASDVVRGVGLNYDGSLGMARGQAAYFFDTELQLNGTVTISGGGVGAGGALHPLHANQKTLENFGGVYRPDTHLAFAGTADGAIDIIDTYKFTRIGQVTLRDKVVGPLRATLPFPGDNTGLSCGTIPVQDLSGKFIGNAIRLYSGEDFSQPIAATGSTNDACIVVNLFAVTEADGVVVVPVRKADVLKYHPNRSGN
jgi:DNA-binding beta-propeller fold protein YncE